jgi:sulfite reductase (NADPH) flavoprotein alpha-component
MLAEPKLKTLKQLAETLTKEELIWVNGYLAGLMTNGTPEPSEQYATRSVSKITIVFGTDTGNSKKLATGFASKAKRKGITVKLSGLDQYRLSDLQKEEYLVVVISTHGEGEPPAAAKKFYDHIHQNTFSLGTLNYGVLALGDTAYPLFCKAGEDVDARLQTLGGKKIIELQKCDTDYEADANQWFDNLLISFRAGVVPSHIQPIAPRKAHVKKTYTGTVLTKINLNGRGSAKETYHIEIAAEDLDYQPGDSIGIVPENPVEIVEAITGLVNLDPTKKLLHKEEAITAFGLLKTKLNIIYLPERTVKQYAAIVQQEIPATRIDLLNLLKIYPVKDTAQFEEVVAILEPITPRLYSISSSLKTHEGEVHITVARNCFTINGERRQGLCSDYLAHVEVNSSFGFYVHKNSQFKLPAPEKDIIMIGPGTGVAPFRAFTEERDATGASGKSWLFFGDQHFETDFLYQTEIQSYLQTGSLTRANVAFSRDQREKVYVQHKMLEHADEFYRWLEAGAYVYVCGAKDPMSEDVERALLQIIMNRGNKTQEQAQDYLNQLKEEGRYEKDVY